MPDKKITCLLIDDDTEDQEIFAHALEHLDLNIDCVTVSDGVRAIEKMKADSNFDPYFIFIDVNMPRMSGIDCLVEIKKISKFKNTPVYLYSTYADPDTISNAKKEGAKDVLVKASSMQELRSMLTGVMKSNGIKPSMTVIR